MKRMIRCNSLNYTAEDVRRVFEDADFVVLDTPDFCVQVNEEGITTVTNYTDAAAYLNTLDELVDDSIIHTLYESYCDEIDCGVEKFDLDGSENKVKLAHLFREAGQDIPDWLFD